MGKTEGRGNEMRQGQVNTWKRGIGKVDWTSIALLTLRK